VVRGFAAITAVVFVHAIAGAQEPSIAVRDAFLKMLERPRVSLEPSVRSRPDASLIVEEISFVAEPGSRVPTLLFKRQGQASRRPVVIVLHGTGGSKDGMVSRLRTIADRGFVAVAIDGRYHGERTGRGAEGMSSYQYAILKAFRGNGERPFLYDTVWDVMRLIDYLETRADVDSRRIGLTGISKGGMETYLTAAVDPRVAVAVPMIGVQSFGWALDHGAWDSRAWTMRDAINAAAAGDAIDAAFMRRFYDRIAPGLRAEFDGPAMLPLIAPRPLLVINGDSDPRTPLAGVRSCMAAADPAYKVRGAGDRIALHVQPDTGHQVTADADRAALQWFERWLEPGR
jgi:dienelactone hydrolase